MLEEESTEVYINHESLAEGDWCMGYMAQIVPGNLGQRLGGSHFAFLGVDRPCVREEDGNYALKTKAVEREVYLHFEQVGMGNVVVEGRRMENSCFGCVVGSWPKLETSRSVGHGSTVDCDVVTVYRKSIVGESTMIQMA